MRLEDLTGKIFHSLTAISREKNRGRVTIWRWLCACGNETLAAADKVKSGHTRSCGCLWRETCRKHGHGHDKDGKQTRTYKAWVNMRSRAAGVTEHYKKYYEGITVCAEWEVFKNFLRDMGECPAGMTLDRKDGTKGYYLKNCRWATHKEQTLNRSRTIWVEIDGEDYCLKDACKKTGVLYDTALKRVRAGQSPQQAIGISPNK